MIIGKYITTLYSLGNVSRDDLDRCSRELKAEWPTSILGFHLISLNSTRRALSFLL